MVSYAIYQNVDINVYLIERGATSTDDSDGTLTLLSTVFISRFSYLDVGAAMFNQNKSSIAAGGPPSDNDLVLRILDEAGLIRDSNDLTLKKTG